MVVDEVELALLYKERDDEQRKELISLAVEQAMSSDIVVFNNVIRDEEMTDNNNDIVKKIRDLCFLNRKIVMSEDDIHLSLLL